MKTVLCVLMMICAGTVFAQRDGAEFNGPTREKACGDMKAWVIKQGSKWKDECTCREEDGWYFCPTQALDDLQSITINQISDLSQAMACAQAKVIAIKLRANRGECNCRSNPGGKTHICKLEVTAKKEELDSIEELIRRGTFKLIEMADEWCKANRANCPPPPPSKPPNRSDGVRG